MGWKCDLVVIDDASRSPKELLEGLVGGPLRKAGTTTLDEAFAPSPPLGGLALGGRTVLFLGSVRSLIAGDTPALEGRLARSSRGRPALALHLHSVINAYGWRSWAQGRAIRVRLGQHPDVLVDEGEALRTERAFFGQYTRRGDELVDADGEAWTHDALGEEVVFALLDAATGWRPDRDEGDAEVTLFEAEPRRRRHTLEVEGEPLLVNPSVEDVTEALRALRSRAPSFAILESTAAESWVQTGGSPEACVVEARFSLPRGAFRHLAAGRGGRREPIRHVSMSAGGVRAPGDEVLTGADAERIFLQFLRDGTTCGDYAWRDKTAEMS